MKYICIVNEKGLAVLKAADLLLDSIRIPPEALEKPPPTSTLDGNSPVTALALPEAIQRVLANHRITTIEQLYERGEDGLLKLAGMGPGKIRRINEELEHEGLEKFT